MRIKQIVTVLVIVLIGCAFDEPNKEGPPTIYKPYEETYEYTYESEPATESREQTLVFNSDMPCTEQETEEQTVAVVKEIDYSKDYVLHWIGECEITFYCACQKCCGKTVDNPAYGITASGTVANQGRTIAVDPELIPLGTRVYIEDYGFFIAEDTGKSIIGKKIDIYIADHEECLQLGVKQANTYVFQHIEIIKD